MNAGMEIIHYLVSCNRVVRKLQFLNNFHIKIAFLQPANQRFVGEKMPNFSLQTREATNRVAEQVQYTINALSQVSGKQPVLHSLIVNINAFLPF